jgi:hypothetical protein
MASLFSLLCVLVGVALVISDYAPPMPSFEASKYTQWGSTKVGASKSGVVDISFDDGDYIKMKVLDLVGNGKERGFAHGALLAHDIQEFMGPKLDTFFSQQVQDLDVSGLPESLQKIIKHTDGKRAPDVFRQAMSWVYENEKSFFPQRLIDEMDAIAEGVCSVVKDCDVEATKAQIKQMNMLPELIRMSCTAFGAWGDATGNNGLIQLRALDFGDGPWGNYTVVSTNRPNPASDANDGPQNAFVSVSFPGMVGVITGISEHGIGVSEKVWMTYDTPNMQKGSYDGEADVLVLRDILELSATKEDAEQYMQDAKRTWGIWVGTGDHKSGEFALTAYRQEDAVVYDDKTMPSMTGQPYMKSVVYVDKHPQPSAEGPNGSLPSALDNFYGNINLETTKQIVQAHETGDVHFAAYDFSNNMMSLGIGKIDENGAYGSDDKEWKAYNRPTTTFNLADMFTGKY